MYRRVVSTLLPSLMFVLAFAAPIGARAYDLPPCTRAEFRTIFDQIAESQLKLDTFIDDVDSLLDFAQAQIDQRDESASYEPPCADNLAFRQMITELTGDFVGRTALDLADLPAADNPYRVQLDSDQERLEDLAAGMLSIDRSLAPEPAERSTPKCALDQLTALMSLPPEFLALLDGETDDPITAIDSLLRWRESRIPQLPACADGIELALLLSAAATDAAALIAMDYVSPDELNPYKRLLADAEHRLSEWKIQANERRSRYKIEPSTTVAALPACSVAELARAYDKLMPEYTDLLQSAREINSAADLLDYSEAYFNYRQDNLSRLPACAEVFAAAWEVRQLLGDLTSAAARGIVAEATDDDPFEARLEEGSARAAQKIDSMASRLEDAGSIPRETGIETAAACADAEVLILQIYLVPGFHDFVNAALSTETREDVFELTDRSLELRDMLWRQLPRCAEAIELGLLMRRVAADFIAMLWLETAGLPVEDIPQLQALVDDLIWFSARVERISTAASAGQAGKSYYISAERGANIRACGSTDCAIVATALRGAPIMVADDSGAWYKVNLPNNQVGYIASFLVSASPPG